MGRGSMYFSNYITEAAPFAPDAPSRTRLQLADLLDLSGGARKSEVFATMPGQSMCNPNHLCGSSAIQFANAGRNGNSDMSGMPQEDAADAKRGFAQCGQPTCDNRVLMLGEPQTCVMLPEQ